MSASNHELHVNFICLSHGWSLVWCSQCLELAGILREVGEVKKNLKWLLLTLPFIGGRSNIDKNEPHCVNYMCAKNWISTTFGLGAVREHRHTHTHKYVKRNKNMDAKGRRDSWLSLEMKICWFHMRAAASAKERTSLVEQASHCRTSLTSGYFDVHLCPDSLPINKFHGVISNEQQIYKSYLRDERIFK